MWKSCKAVYDGNAWPVKTDKMTITKHISCSVFMFLSVRMINQKYICRLDLGMAQIPVAKIATALNKLESRVRLEQEHITVGQMMQISESVCASPTRECSFVSPSTK